MKLPLVAICGRPNVGKSTLYNRLTRSREALVHDLPGMTRDRTYGRVLCCNEEGEPEELFELVDTGGLDFEGEDVITQGITRLAQAAMNEAHVVVLMVDAHDGWNPVDAEIASLRAQNGALLRRLSGSTSDKHAPSLAGAHSPVCLVEGKGNRLASNILARAVRWDD